MQGLLVQLDQYLKALIQVGTGVVLQVQTKIVPTDPVPMSLVAVVNHNTLKGPLTRNPTDLLHLISLVNPQALHTLLHLVVLDHQVLHDQMVQRVLDLIIQAVTAQIKVEVLSPTDLEKVREALNLDLQVLLPLAAMCLVIAAQLLDQDQEVEKDRDPMLRKVNFLLSNS